MIVTILKLETNLEPFLPWNIHCTLVIKQWLLEVLGTQTTQIKCAYLWYIENDRFLFILSFSDFDYTSCRILYTIMQTPDYDTNVIMGINFCKFMNVFATATILGIWDTGNATIYKS